MELESGQAPGLTGSLGDGVGKRRLDGKTAGSVLVMSLISSPTGHPTNLSTRLLVTAEGTLQVMSLGYGADGFLADLSLGAARPRW